MRKFILFVSAIFICTVCFAQTIRWHVGDTVIRTDTCSSGDSITPPTAPVKPGYHFVEWEGYKPIKYLESTGTQWIDTGIVANQNTSIELDYALSSAGTSITTIFFGARTGLEQNVYTIQNRSATDGKPVRIILGYNNDPGLSQNTILPDTERHVIYKKKNEQYFDGVLMQTMNYSSFSTPGSCYLFSANNNGSLTQIMPMKVYELKMWNNNVLVRDFIPVLDTNGVPCMYDKVTHRFFYNAGTGQFVAGNPI